MRRTNHTPPRWATRLIRWLGHPDTHEEVEGDLLELYAHWVRTETSDRHGTRRANWRYVLNALRLLRPWARSKHVPGRRSDQYSTPFLLSPDMIRNYFLVAVRSLLKQKLYAGINIFGLALGMACSLLIGLWVRDELSFDRFLPDATDLYFVRVNYSFRGGPTETAYATPGPLAEVIKRDIPDVAATTKLSFDQELLVRAGRQADGLAAKERGHFATASFFDVFDLPALAGNPKTALAQPNQLIITKTLADKYFPQTAGQYQSVLGQSLQLDNTKLYTIGAVLDNLPGHSSLQFDWLANFKNIEEPWTREWGTNGFLTYLRLRHNAPSPRAEAAMHGLFRRYATFNNKEAVVLHPVVDQRLYADYQDGKIAGGRIEYVRLLTALGLLLLLIACINFINLSTARSASRAKEIGVRKVIGAGRLSLAWQFMGEAVLTSLLAVVVAFWLAWGLLPLFNQLAGKQLHLALADPVLWGLLAALLAITSLLSGSYPALYLSSLLPTSVFKGTSGQLTGGAGPLAFRRSLVVCQFSLSIFLIACMLLVDRQLNFLRTKNLGLNRENVLYIPLEGITAQPEKKEAYRQRVLLSPAVATATLAKRIPVNIGNTSTDLLWSGKDPRQLVSVSTMAVGTDFTRTMRIPLLDGRDFQERAGGDSSNYLINEAAAKLMGMPHPVGQIIQFSMGKGRVIGLMKDFHLKSLHEAITPLVLTYYPGNTNYLLVRPRTNQTQRAIADLQGITTEVNPATPFAYHFLDEAYAQLYEGDQQAGRLINCFGVLAILISCLGLFGLATFTAEQRTKEIGIRKVLGASVSSIVALLSKDFVKLVMVAIVIASPAGWWAMHRWLQAFAYKIDISWWIFALAGTLAVLIALLTVSFQSIRAALMNPVKSLRSE